MPEPLLYAKAMATAAVVSAMLVLVMTTVRRSAHPSWLNSACILGTGLGLAVGYGMLTLGLAWPPVNGLDRLITIVFPVTLGIELVAGFQRTPRAFAWLLRLGLAATIPRILLHDSVYLSGFVDSSGSGDSWTQWQTVGAMAIAGLLLASLWSLLSWLSRRSPGVSIPLALGLTIQSAAMAVMMAGYIKGGAAALPLVATLVAVTIAADLLSKRLDIAANFDGAAILGVGVAGLFGIVFIGRFFGQLSTLSAVTLLLAPLLCWVTEAPALRHRKAWLVGSLRLVLVAIPLIIVLVAAKREFDREMYPLIGSLQLDPHLTCSRSGRADASSTRLDNVTLTDSANCGPLTLEAKCCESKQKTHRRKRRWASIGK